MTTTPPEALALAERLDEILEAAKRDEPLDDLSALRQAASRLRSLTAELAQVTRERDEADFIIRALVKDAIPSNWHETEDDDPSAFGAWRNAIAWDVEGAATEPEYVTLLAEIAALKLERDEARLHGGNWRQSFLDAMAEAETLRARVEVLAGALRPFGKIGNWLKHSPPETRLALADPKNIPGEHLLTAEQFYRAFAALSPTPPAEADHG